MALDHVGQLEELGERIVKLRRQVEELERDNAMLREQVRVGDVCSDYHMKRTRLVEQANELANQCIGSLSNHIEKLMQMIQLHIEESERQTILMALAHLAVERPGWDYMCSELAKKMDNVSEGPSVKSRHMEALKGRPCIDVEAGKPILYEHFKFYHTEHLKHDASKQTEVFPTGQQNEGFVQAGGGS